MPKELTKSLIDTLYREVPSGCMPIYMANAMGRQVYAVVDQCWFNKLAGFDWYNKKGYAVRYEKSGNGKLRMIYMHREIMELDDGVSLPVDHINGDTLDNRRSNLRLATISQNTQNKRHGTGTSRYLGVSYEPKTGKWRCRIVVDGKTIQLGTWPSEEVAAQQYDKAAVKYFGPNARTNTYGENVIPAGAGEECPYCAKIVKKLRAHKGLAGFKPGCAPCNDLLYALKVTKIKINQNEQRVIKQKEELVALESELVRIKGQGDKLREERNGS
jgi:hypothetical protein